MPLIDPITMSTPTPPPQTLTKPINLLPTPLANLFSTAHPALLLSYYYLRFPSLVADPVTTLLHALAPITLIQITYAVICLPAAGSSSKKVKPGKKQSFWGAGEGAAIFVRSLLSLSSHE